MQVAKLGEHGVKPRDEMHVINLVEEDGACNAIPDFQREIQELKSKLAHMTALRDKIEGQKDALTRSIHKLEAEKVYMGLDIKRLQSKVGELVMENTNWTHAGASRQIIEDTQYTTDGMRKTLGAEDRAAKRPREEGMEA